MNILGRTDLVHVLDKPEVENLGNEAGMNNSPTIGDRKPELSEVRVMGNSPAVNLTAGNVQSFAARVQHNSSDGRSKCCS